MSWPRFYAVHRALLLYNIVPLWGLLPPCCQSNCGNSSKGRMLSHECEIKFLSPPQHTHIHTHMYVHIDTD